jgi:hypothetical protein
MRSVLAAAVSATRQGPSFALLLRAMSKPSAFSYLSGNRVVAHQASRRFDVFQGMHDGLRREQPTWRAAIRTAIVSRAIGVSRRRSRRRCCCVQAPGDAGTASGAALLGGIGGFVTTLAVQTGLWLREVLAIDAEQAV